MKRVLAWLGVAFAAGMCLVVVAPTPALAYVAPPAPVPVVIPPVAAGTPTVVTGSQVVGLTLAGLAAFDGTCYVLGEMFHRDDPCGGSATKTVFNFLFGAGGDERPVPTGAFWQAAGGDPKAIMNYLYGGYKSSVGALVRCSNAAGTLIKTFWYMIGSNYYSGSNYNSAVAACGGYSTSAESWYTSGGIAFGYPMGGNGRSANSLCGEVCNVFVSATFYQGLISGAGTLVSNLPNPDKVVYAEAAQPWTLDYTVSCQKGATIVDVHAQVKFTPTPGGTAPEPNFPQTCEQALPGSHVRELAVQGGRDTIENPEVNVHYPTFNPAAETAYPLCTTSAPGNGCWLDLQKNGKSCFGPDVYCSGWTQNITRWNMSCQWGPYELAISQCTAKYGTKFDLQTQPQPNPSPSPTVPPAPNPCYVNCTRPPIQPEPPVDPRNPDYDEESCIQDAFSWNPIDWVYVPVKCVLQWAFVPRTLPDFGDVPSPIPGGWVPSFPALGNGSCGPLTMPSLDFPVIGHTSARTIVNTCNAPWPVARGFTYYGLLAMGLVGLMQRAFYAVSRAAGMDVDTPSGGGDD